MAMLVMRWASLFGRAALTSENARRHPHVPLAPAVLDEKVRAGMRRAMRDMLYIDAGYIVIEKWLSKLMGAEAEQHAEWEWRHTGAEHEDCPPSLCADYKLVVALLRDALEVRAALSQAVQLCIQFRADSRQACPFSHSSLCVVDSLSFLSDK